MFIKYKIQKYFKDYFVYFALIGVTISMFIYPEMYYPIYDKISDLTNWIRIY